MVNRRVRHKQGRKKKGTSYTLVTHKSVANECTCYKKMLEQTSEEKSECGSNKCEENNK